MTARALLAAGIALLAAPVATAQPGGGPPPASVVLDPARLETIEQWREVTGTLRAVRRALLAAEEEGLVIEMLHDEGEPVEEGEVIARLDDARARIDVARAEAELAASRATAAERAADVQKAERDQARVDELFTKGSAVQMEVDDRRTLLEAARARSNSALADADAAAADLELARERLADMTLRSPFAGRIISKQTEIGQWLQRGNTVVELVALDMIEARLDVPERFIDQLMGSGVQVQVRLLATGETVAAPITAIIPDADPLSRLFPVRVRLVNTDGKLRPGMSVVGLVPTGIAEPTLTVAKDAIRRDDAGEFLFFNEGGAAAVARVQTLFAVGDRVAVRSARLADGVQVVVEGNERLFPGAPLAVPPAAGGSN